MIGELAHFRKRSRNAALGIDFWNVEYVDGSEATPL
jgi:hypothetical protein